ncbi:MAG TPA: protein kinase [Kofleriaceae bacterium]|nr:protein kinase [Kofleriaceae bacterium]
MGTSPKGLKTTEPPPLAVKLGDVVLGRYRIVEQIASGGHSVVFRGQDERLSRPVCIKVFSGFGGNSGVGRTSYEHFVQEAFALSRLTHPNTLRIYDFGHLGPKDAEGMPLQVCEYMNGGTLSNIMRDQGTQSLDETARIVTAMCLALGEAHGLGIVHRDIKPQNILFGTVGGSRLPKLADFGIAKWSADDDNKEQRAEDTAIVAGQKLAMYSPSWAAPEQLAGQIVSPATDIYSLACVAVYMLSGKAIFADEDVYAGYRKRRHAEQLVREALEPLAVPPAVIKLLARALEFDPRRRLANVEELSGDFATALEPETNEQPSLRASEAATPPTNRPSNAPAPAPSVGSQPGIPIPQGPSPSPHGASSSAQPSFPGAQGPSPVPHAGLASSPNAQASPNAGEHAPLPLGHAPAPPASPGWSPPPILRPWMLTTPAVPPQSIPRHLALSDLAQPVGDRRVHFVLAANNIADLIGSHNSKIRVTFLSGPTGARQLHLKGLTCFVAHLGGRPSPAVQLEHASDIALVTPRAQEIGHVRVATGTPGVGLTVFTIGAERVGIAPDDCMDAILFDFGPGSEAYFVYTRGRPIPKSRRG